MTSARALVAGIAGGTSSGKTTVARAIAETLGEQRVVLLEHDSYYRDLPEFGGLRPEEINYDHPDAYDTGLFREHIRLLRNGSPVDQPVYDYTTYRRSGVTRRVDPRPLLILDGILLFAEPGLRELIDIKVYVDTDDDERLLRRIRRDVLDRGRSVEGVMHQYITTVKPMHLEFVEPSKRWADVIVPRGGENRVAIEMVTARLHALGG